MLETLWRRRLGWAALSGGVLVVLFWVVYVTRPGAFGPATAEARAFESAFLLADGLFAITLFAASRSLFAGTRAGPFLLVAAASMSLYLGLLDLAFYAREGRYALPGLAVNLLCLGGGLLGIRIAWTLWRRA